MERFNYPLQQFSFRRNDHIRRVIERIRRKQLYSHQSQHYRETLMFYLRYLRELGLDGEHVVASCEDLVESLLTNDQVIARAKQKGKYWKALREPALTRKRSPKMVYMELDPIYFASILARSKSYEGRAFNPYSDKDYHDIREHDTLRFHLSTRKSSFATQIEEYGFSPAQQMECEVVRVLHAPQVHAMFLMPSVDSKAFLPQLDGTAFDVRVQRAAVYYEFPGYKRIIDTFGFVAIEVINPHLI